MLVAGKSRRATAACRDRRADEYVWRDTHDKCRGMVNNDC